MTNLVKVDQFPPDGGQAFPSTFEIDRGDGKPREVHISCGMSLRDYFAGQVIPHVLTGNITAIVHGGASQEPDAMARDAYKLADAMIAEREKKGAP